MFILSQKTLFLYGRGADLGSGRGSGIGQWVVSNCSVHNLFLLVLFFKSYYYHYYLTLLLNFSFASITKLFLTQFTSLLLILPPILLRGA